MDELAFTGIKCVHFLQLIIFHVHWQLWSCISANPVFSQTMADVMQRSTMHLFCATISWSNLDKAKLRLQKWCLENKKGLECELDFRLESTDSSVNMVMVMLLNESEA